MTPAPYDVRHPNNELRMLMHKHQLMRADVAELLGMAVRKYSNGTVDAWLSGRRNIPPAKLELLKMKLENRNG